MTQTVPDISPLMPMHQDPLLVSVFRAAVAQYLWYCKTSTCSIRHRITKLCFSSCLVHCCSCLCLFAQSIEARCYVENEDVVGAVPTGDAPTTSEWSSLLRVIKFIAYHSVTYIRGFTVLEYLSDSCNSKHCGWAIWHQWHISLKDTTRISQSFMIYQYYFNQKMQTQKVHGLQQQ